jgi:hypothetical protein
MDLKLVKITFYITFTFLIITAVITLSQAILFTNPEIRTIMGLEATVAIIAAIFYFLFATKTTIDYREITNLRYGDWSFTAPLMLIGLMMVLGYNRIPFSISTYVLIAFLTYGMLLMGALGEKQIIPRTLADFTGFTFFAAIFGIIWYIYVRGSNDPLHVVIFVAFVIIWALYGVVYLEKDEETRNIVLNILDAIAKSFVGLFFWVYCTRIIRF